MTKVRIAAFLFLAISLLEAQTPRDTWLLVDSLKVEKLIGAGGSYAVYFDSAAQRLRDTLLSGEITPRAESAVQAAPAWLRRPLLDNFRRLSQSFQNQYANLILHPPASNYLDEICFPIAYLSPQTLEAMDPAIVDSNVAQIYRIRSYLGYVILLDYGSDSSTTMYRIVRSSDTSWVTIPKEAYYWYVVMPKLVMERPKMDGSVFDKFWRDYLWNVAYTVGTPGENRHLGDVLPMASVFWNEDTLRVDSHTDFSYTDCALATIGKWVAKTIANGGGAPGRPNQPNVICNYHQGTCSELRMVLAAAARTGLIPVIGTWDFNENHHWDELWWNGAWYMYQVNLGYNSGDGWCYINFPGCAGDRKYGGGKNVSIIWNERADEYQESVVDVFSDICTLSVWVKDANQRPVDGCKVTLYSRDWWGGVTAGLQRGTTDRNGYFQFKIGDWRDYWLALESDIGTLPQTQIIDSANCQPGRHFQFSYNLSGNMPSLSYTSETLPPQQNWKLVVKFSNGEEAVYGYNSTYYNGAPLYYEEDPGWYRLMGYPGKTDFFVCDRNNFTSFCQGHPFRGYGLHQDTTAIDFPFVLPTGGNYYCVFSNREQLNVSDFLPIECYLYQHSVGIEEKKKAGGTGLKIRQNPIRGMISVAYSLPDKGPATLTICNTLGRLVYSARSDDGLFIAKGLPAGVYFLRLEAKGYQENRKVVTFR